MPTPQRARKIRWEQLPSDEPLPLVSRRHVAGSQAMLSRFELAAGGVVPSHKHENEQFACVLSGRVRFVVGEGKDEEELVLEGGEILHLPPWVAHGAFAIQDAVVLDVFAPPSEGSGVDAVRGAAE